MDCDFWEGLARRVNYQSRKAESQLLKGTYLGERESSLSRGEISSAVPKIDPPGRSSGESNQLSERSIRLLDRIQHTSSGVGQSKGRAFEKTRTLAEPSSYSSYYDTNQRLSPRGPTFQIRTTEAHDTRDIGFLARQKLFEESRPAEPQPKQIWQPSTKTLPSPRALASQAVDLEKSTSQYELSLPLRTNLPNPRPDTSDPRPAPSPASPADAISRIRLAERPISEKPAAVRLTQQTLTAVTIRGTPKPDDLTEGLRPQTQRLRIHNIADIQIRSRQKQPALDLTYLMKVVVAGSSPTPAALTVESLQGLVVNKQPKLSLCLSPIEAIQRCPAGHTGEETSWRIVEKSLLHMGGPPTETLRPFHVQQSQDSNNWLHVPGPVHQRQRTADFGGEAARTGVAGPAAPDANKYSLQQPGRSQLDGYEQAEQGDDHLHHDQDDGYPTRLSIKHFLEKLTYDVYIRDKEVKQRLGEVCRRLDTNNHVYNPVVIGYKPRALPKVRVGKRVKSEGELRREVREVVAWAAELRKDPHVENLDDAENTYELRREEFAVAAQVENQKLISTQLGMEAVHQDPSDVQNNRIGGEAVTNYPLTVNQDRNDHKSQSGDQIYSGEARDTSCVQVEGDQEEEVIQHDQEDEFEEQSAQEEGKQEDSQEDSKIYQLDEHQHQDDEATGNEEQLPLVVEENTEEFSQNDPRLLDNEENNEIKEQDPKNKSKQIMKGSDARVTIQKSQSPTLRAQKMIRNPGGKPVIKPQVPGHLSRTSSLSTDQQPSNTQKASKRVSQSQPKQPVQPKTKPASKPTTETSRASQSRPGRQQPDPKSVQQPKLGKSPSASALPQTKQQTGSRPASAHAAGGVGSSSSQSQSRHRTSSYQQRFEAAQKLRRPDASGDNQTGNENKKPRVPGRAEWTKWVKPETLLQKDPVDPSETVDGMFAQLDSMSPAGALKPVKGGGTPVAAADLRRNQKLEPKAMLQHVVLFPAARNEGTSEETPKDN